MAEPTIHDKIRKLLALAERAGTPEEAEAATAAAERLIDKHAVDLAMLQDARGSKGKPTSRRMPVPGPYVTPKQALLNAVAKAYNVVGVRHQGSKTGDVTLIGFESDLESVELLYASLVIQAAGAVSKATPTHYRTGIKAFRHAFLYGFAGAVDSRLQAARRDTVQSTPGSALVLRDRKSEVDAAAAQLFPRLTSGRSARINAEGSQAGNAAGRQADLGQTRFAGRNQSQLA